MVILLVGMMALLSAATISIDRNLDNILRDEAVQVADQRMREVKANSQGSFIAPFQNLSNPSHVYSKLRGKNFQYTTTLTALATGANSNVLTVQVTWQLKGTPKQLEFTTLKTY